MEAIKHSRIIVVLLILYIGISILVVTLDKIQTKKGGSSDSTAEAKKKKENIDSFTNEVSDITDSVLNYASNYDLTSDTCFKLSQILGLEYSGSAYVASDLSSVRLWYKNEDLGFAVNNIETRGIIIEKDDIEDSYTTEFYNSCGFNE